MGQVLSQPKLDEDCHRDGDSQSPPPPYNERPQCYRQFNDIKMKEQAPPLSNHPAFRKKTAKMPKTSNNRNSCVEQKPGHSFLKPIQVETTITAEFCSFNTSDPSITPAYPRKGAGIRAATNPQWRWNNAQCRTWIACVLNEYAGKSHLTAKELAKKFDGFGPNLWVMEWDEWYALLGADGEGICALLIAARDEDGAVPKGVKILWNSRREL
jgi:hypothetical protein